ncbi:GGDEF domain-containing protein [Butyrivibrio sp. VCB2001]|uniref:GGDEF domain-containing protein n=1 Tax=Butyrivibrio sp. VCB2001 TaxID=1280667 RepID=UPI0003FE37CB|nr:GGDEF domain-containing protein [Butyrivibrio sp. VCB2001]
MNIGAVATSDFMGFILLIALLISSKIRRTDDKHPEFKLYTVIAILTMVACVVDFISFYVDGINKPGMRLVNILTNTFCFAANPLFVASWCLYEDLKLYRSMTRVKKIYTYAFIPAVIMVLIAIVNMFVPIIFRIDEQNVYSRLPFSYVYYIVDIGYVLFSIFIYKGYERRYGKIRFFPLYLMIGPIVLGCAIQVVIYGVSLMWISTAVGLTAIYMSIQNEFSYLDKLTGLYNRAYLDYLLETSTREKNNLGGIMIDVDYFKQINDTYGHSYGDEALIDVARIITFGKPDKAVALRFAGDEFIILIKGVSEKQLQSIITSIRDELKLFNETEERRYKLSLSLGGSIYEPAHDSIDNFLKRMDDAMYEEKKEKHSR